MPAFIDMTGHRFGRLFVLGPKKGIYKNRIVWLCRCDCGAEKLVFGSDLKAGKVKSCGCLRNEIVVRRNKTRIGKKSDCWKGGEIRQCGYVVRYAPDHPTANAMGKGYVRRARLVMEEYLGRYLEADEIVHHINRKKDDDRIENLELMTNSEHLSLHHKGKKVARDESGRFTKGGGA